jgi:hypothetical protein
VTAVEEWRPIPDIPLYEVSNRGRVRSWNRVRDSLEPRILSPVKRGSGHLYVALPGRISRQVHHLVALAFIGPRPDGLVLRHLDDDRTNNRVDNLAYGTPSENQHDSVANGTHYRATRTHCPRGHEYSDENTRLYTPAGANKPYRWCRACDRSRKVSA